MIDITKIFMQKKLEIISIMFHSTSLKTGFNEFTKTKTEMSRIVQRIKSFLQSAKRAGIEKIKVTDAPQLIRPPQ